MVWYMLTGIAGTTVIICSIIIISARITFTALMVFRTNKVTFSIVMFSEIRWDQEHQVRSNEWMVNKWEHQGAEQTDHATANATRSILQSLQARSQHLLLDRASMSCREMCPLHWYPDIYKNIDNIPTVHQTYKPTVHQTRNN